MPGLGLLLEPKVAVLGPMLAVLAALGASEGCLGTGSGIITAKSSPNLEKWPKPEREQCAKGSGPPKRAPRGPLLEPMLAVLGCS